ncbi:MAG: DUF6504 family protein [Chloroflexota bacterium]
MTPQFFGQEIKVTVSGEVKTPAAFRLGDNDYVIAEIIETWPDYGFGHSPLRRKRWWQRHHRNYYRVRTTTGEVFEIYHDRGTNLSQAERQRWYLYRQL